MDSERFARLKKLFDGVADLSPSELEAYLAQNDMGDDTRRSLHELLEADAALVGSTVRRATPPAAFSSANDTQAWVGRRVGAFVIEGELGRGGMGSVFLAHRVDESVTQKVALKVVRRERIDANTLARFRLERQVLAVLKHPNIATLLDAGELDDGTPFVAMEYIEGVPIIEFAQSQQLGLRQRLHLFLAVCDAVSYAHRNMVVHRDIKSSNILVTADGQPKLLDFGIAKPLIARLGVHDIEQTSEAHRFFSPYNAAPEQIRGDVITVACDVYGLGTLLYELLTGVPPFEFAGKTPAQIESTILDTEPQRPSARTSRPVSYTERALRGDLDAIVSRTLRKNPESRYPAVDHLTADIGRYLSSLPVEARDGTYIYRLNRFVSRHRLALASTALVVVLAGVFGWVSVQQYVSTQQERARADTVTTLIFGAIGSVDPDRAQGKELTAREVFEQVEVLAEHAPNVDAATRQRLIATVAKIDVKLGVPKDAQVLLDQIKPPSGNRLSSEEADVLRTFALTALANDQFDLAQKYIEQGSAAASGADVYAWRMLQAKADMNRRDDVAAQKDLDAILNAGDKADEETRLTAREALIEKLFDGGRLEEAYAQASALLKEQRQRLPNPHPALLHSLDNVLELAINLGKLDEARPLLKEDTGMSTKLYGEHSLGFTKALQFQADLLTHEGHLDQAIEVHRRVLEISKSVLGEEAPTVANDYFNLANATDEAGRAAEAEPHYLKAVELAERTMPAKSLRLLIFRTVLAYNQTRNHHFAESDKSLADVTEMLQMFPEFTQFDLPPVGRLIGAQNAWALAPTVEHHKAYEKALVEARKAAEGESTKQQIEQVENVQKELMTAGFMAK
jgi:serine/threonine protein kinase/tetratricopeptide (TPR) repeat protein